MTTESKLAEFFAAQNRVYDQVLRELAAGRKETHWIWFIFPQITGLGSSGMSQRFGIAAAGMHGVDAGGTSPGYPLDSGRPRRPEVPILDDAVCRRGS